MSKITSIISCKGGVGKTTSAVNISSYIHTQGKRVLAVDLDYQHNLSKHFGIFPGHLKDKPTVGSIEIPDEVPIPEADITMKTRKGVEVTYLPAATPATTAV